MLVRIAAASKKHHIGHADAEAGQADNALRAAGYMSMVGGYRAMMVKCQACGNVYGSPPKQVGDLCPMPQCGHVLVAYRR